MGRRFGDIQAGYDARMTTTFWRQGLGMVAACLALQAHAEGQIEQLGEGRERTDRLTTVNIVYGF